MRLALTTFLGANQALDPLLLPPGVGVEASNMRTDRGGMRPWNEPVVVGSVPPGAATLYRMGRDVIDESQYWIGPAYDAHYVRLIAAGDTTERTAVTGGGNPRVFDNVTGLASQPYPTTTRALGLPAPTVKPTATLGAAPDPTADEFTRYYVYTWVSDWGWESAPSPTSDAVVIKAGQPVTVTGLTTVPSGSYSINRLRLYASQLGASGNAEFFFHSEHAVGTTSVVDTGQELGEPCPTVMWLPAPGVWTGTSFSEAPLKCLTPMWNGMIAGVTGGTVRICVPYTPYAWPLAHEIAPPDCTAVALGVVGQQLVILTTGKPMVAAGSSPEAMDTQTLELPQACVSPMSVVSMGSGVAWASADGLCWYGAGGARVLTAGVLTREDWQGMNPESVRGCMFEGVYFGSFNMPGQPRRGFIIDPSRPGHMTFLTTGYKAAYFDDLMDQLYAVDSSGQVLRWGASTTPMQAKFVGSVIETPLARTPPLCARVIASQYPVTVAVWADGVKRAEISVPDAKPARMPGGYRARRWQLEVRATGAVQAVVLADSVPELEAPAS